MKHSPKATANALAVVAGALYFICAAWTLLSRTSYMGVMNTWVHGLDLSSLPAKTPDLGTLLVGFVSFVVVAWLTGYTFAVTYNNFAKT